MIAGLMAANLVVPASSKLVFAATACIAVTPLPPDWHPSQIKICCGTRLRSQRAHDYLPFFTMGTDIF